MDFKPQSRTGRQRPGTKVPPVAVELPAGLAARLAAVMALADVVGQGRSFDEALSAAANHPKITPQSDRDRALTRSIVTVALRRLGTLRWALGRLLDKGWPRKAGSFEWIMLVTAAQILFLDVPDHAAVNSCVQAVRLDSAAAPYAALANAVARNLIRQKDEFEVIDPFVGRPALAGGALAKGVG